MGKMGQKLAYLKLFKKLVLIFTEFVLKGEGNLIFCCTGSRENYFGSVGRQNNNNTNPKFQGRHITLVIEIAYESKQISLLCESMKLGALNYCFLTILL